MASLTLVVTEIRLCEGWHFRRYDTGAVNLEARKSQWTFTKAMTKDFTKNHCIQYS